MLLDLSDTRWSQKYADEMRGVHAKEPIGTDEIINSIPLKCLITCEMGKATEV